ncbi:MAG: UDP-N-acetylmuramate--L-alanine ligase [Planctomycetes bacterium]|nr:UDP-N-acetylmuramate--L-alanine ligase [Planctomycetota bacterium]
MQRPLAIGSDGITREAVTVFQPIEPIGLSEARSAVSLRWSQSFVDFQERLSLQRDGFLPQRSMRNQQSMSPQSVASRHQKRLQIEPKKTSRFASAHLVGICGTGMKALAELLSGMGWKVSGSDLKPPNRTVRALKRRGLRIHSGHHDQYLPKNVDVLVYSPAIGPTNPERQMATRLGIPQMSFSGMLGHLMEDKVGISIAGTHGKSTTTAMTATILGDARLYPSAVIGAQLCGVGVNGWAGDGDFFVVESCEYKKNFLDLRPKHAAFLGIEPDHFDYFPNVDAIRVAFAEFAALLPSDGLLLVRGDCAHSVLAARSTDATVITFSQQPGSQWWATDLKKTVLGTRFRVFHRGEFYAEFSLRIPGAHNVDNALAAIVMADSLGVSVNAIRESIEEFPGIRRRFELVGSWRGITLVDDYAHHPTAVTATLKTAREKFGRRRIWCAFQPHQISRALALMDEFSESFSNVDRILVAPVFAAREEPGGEEHEVARELAERISAKGSDAQFCPSLDRIIATLEDEALPGDVLITMGAGDIDRVHHEFTRRLQRNHPHR